MSNPASLPPGFRFHPTDEELILHYLRNRASSALCPVSIIADVDIYKFDPWDLPSKALYGDNEWYFFSPRDRKYPNGIRPNRAAGSGYWKATGTDKPIHDSASKQSVGVKKALVFYKGRPPKGTKTNWIMHEYRLVADLHANDGNSYRPLKFRSVSMRLDDWVLCRIYKKSSHVSPMVPPLANHDQLDHDEPSGFEDNCLYAPSSYSSTAVITHEDSSARAAQRLPKIPSISELLDEYTLAQLFDAAAPASEPELAPLAGHPSLNQLLVSNNMTEYYSSPVGGSSGKRKVSAEDCGGGLVGNPAAKRMNGSCFASTVSSAAPHAVNGLPVSSSVLGQLPGFSHQIMLNSSLGMN